MWFIYDSAGLICAALTYSIVLTVSIGFFRVGIWEALLAGDCSAYLNLLVFQYHCTLIFWSHFKCMTTEPGVLPMEVEELNFERLAP